jgi:hypothetical protein
MEIQFTGSENNILKILENLPSKSKTIRRIGNSIIIPTCKGAKQIYKGDAVVIDGEMVTVIEK